MRGGIYFTAKRYSKANKKDMKFYDDNEPSKFMMYLDTNYLHGWAMSQWLPYGEFEWLNKKKLTSLM